MNELTLLTDHLAKETAIFDELVSILHKENEDLVGRDYRSLYDTVSKKEHLLVRIQEMERVRLGLVEEVAAALGIPAGEASILSIIKKADHSGKGELQDQLSRTLSIAESIREINSVNSIIVKESLDNINKTLGFLGNFMSNNVYKPDGILKGLSLKGLRLSEGV